MLDLDLGWLAYAKNDFEVKNPLFVTENEWVNRFYFLSI